MNVNTEVLSQGANQWHSSGTEKIRLYRKTFQKPAQLCNNILWTDETKINLYKNDCKKRVWRSKRNGSRYKATTLSVKHSRCSVITWKCMAVNGTWSLMFIDDVTAHGEKQDEFLSV